jgi:hypothetical protein
MTIPTEVPSPRTELMTISLSPVNGSTVKATPPAMAHHALDENPGRGGVLGPRACRYARARSPTTLDTLPRRWAGLRAPR